MHQETSCIKPSKFGVAKGVAQFPSTSSLISFIISKIKLFFSPACHPYDQKTLNQRKIPNSSYQGFEQLSKLMFRQILISKAKQLQKGTFIFPFSYVVLEKLKRSCKFLQKKPQCSSEQGDKDYYISQSLVVVLQMVAMFMVRAKTRTKYQTRKILRVPLCNIQPHPLERRRYSKSLYITYAAT